MRKWTIVWRLAALVLALVLMALTPAAVAAPPAWARITVQYERHRADTVRITWTQTIATPATNVLKQETAGSAEGYILYACQPCPAGTYSVVMPVPGQANDVVRFHRPGNRYWLQALNGSSPLIGPAVPRDRLFVPMARRLSARGAP
ncbi:hypothetical protein SE17_01145 [Kouleothrix aurantiaca]|uniref:Fibronectin type-III domain-containing protein n=1 Tax=Kouleothrix aurantiaca TaxID=186479 RepID=A0A0P9FNI0_9CHLR|nr:hypothetical protein SE17_01145 [Kouleothrix aurantiaca]